MKSIFEISSFFRSRLSLSGINRFCISLSARPLYRNRPLLSAFIAVLLWLPFSTPAALADTVDDIPPTEITDLVLSGATSGSMDLYWTAPGDDGPLGIATLYDVRYATSPIVTSADFSTATQVTGEPAPGAAGTVQNMTISGLAADTLYYFAMTSQDEVSNVSGLSNVASDLTSVSSDLAAPSDITDLALSEPASTSIRLTWSAPGGDDASGTAASYDIRYSTSPILNDVDFAAATPAASEPAPVAAGTVQSVTVGGLASSALYFFTMKTEDEAHNVSGLSNVVSVTTGAAFHPEQGPGASSPTQPAIVMIIQPNGGESLVGDQVIQIVWSSSGSDIQSYALSLSTDDGLTWSPIATAISDNFYAWTVPNAPASLAKVRVQALGAGNVVLTQDDSSTTFIIGTASSASSSPSPSQDDTPQVSFSPSDEIASTPTIDADLGTAPVSAPAPAACVSGSLIKLPLDPDSSNQAETTVYYCGADGKRYVFPDPGTYFSWYSDFSRVTIVSPEVLAAAPIGGNVAYRPGSRLIKIKTDPKVYALSKGGVLHWVPSEAIAEKLYGQNWNQEVSDVAEEFFVDYVLGDPITSTDVTP